MRKKILNIKFTLLSLWILVFTQFIFINGIFAQPSTDIVRVNAGNAHSLVLKSDGTIWGAGYNSQGQLGDYNNFEVTEPTKINGISNVKDVKAGSYHTLALKNNGTVWAFGYNENGQLGIGTNDDTKIPTQVKGISNIKQIDANGNVSIALAQDGTIYTWGYNYSGQLGDGTTQDSDIPVKVKNLSDVKDIYASGVTCFALKSDGTVWAWGANNVYQLSTSTKDKNSLVPIQIPGLNNIKKLAVGTSHTLALTKNNEVYAWGYNNYGEMGNDYKNSIIPRKVNGIENVKDISAGLFASCALENNGTVWVWGSNSVSQSDYGNKTSNPTKVDNLTDIKQLSLSSGGYNFRVALKSDNSVWTWGANYHGELADGTKINRTNFIKSEY
jgi:alpha-tubulin suppressor-like RCC1 family protein